MREGYLYYHIDPETLSELCPLAVLLCLLLQFPREAGGGQAGLWRPSGQWLLHGIGGHRAARGEIYISFL